MVSQRTISKKYDGEKVKKREQYLQKLIDQNMAQTTGLLDKKGFPASLFEDDSHNIPNIDVMTRLPMIHRESKEGGVGWPPVLNKYSYESAFGPGFNQNGDQRRPTEQERLASYELLSENAQSHNFHQINLNLQVKQGQSNFGPDVTSGKSNGRYQKQTSHEQNYLSQDSRGQKHQLLDLKQRLASETSPMAAFASEKQQPEHVQRFIPNRKQGVIPQEQNSLMTEPNGVSSAQRQAAAVKHFVNNSALQVKPSLAQWANSQAKSGSLSPGNADLAKVSHQIGLLEEAHQMQSKVQNNVNLQISRTISNTYPSKEVLDTKPSQHPGLHHEGTLAGSTLQEHSPPKNPNLPQPQYEQSPTRPKGASQSPKQFKAALKAHRDDREILGMPAQLETTNMLKFERQIGAIIANQKGKGMKKRNARYNQSIDFMSSKNNMGILQEEPQDHHQWSVDDDDSFEQQLGFPNSHSKNPALDSRLLRASLDNSSNRNTIASRAVLTGKHQQHNPEFLGGLKLLNSQSIRQSARASIELDSRRTQGFQFEEKFEIVAEDPNTLMSHRERNFQHNKAVISSTLRSGLTRNHKQPKNNFKLQSNHYKYNRMKEGGWGLSQSQAKKDFGISTAPHSSARDFVLPNLGSLPNVYGGNFLEGQRSIQIENPLDSLDHSALMQAHRSVLKMQQSSPTKAVFSREEQLEFELQKKGKKVIRASLNGTQLAEFQDTEPVSPDKTLQNLGLNEYSTAPLDTEVKQMVIAAMPASNRSHILSSKTDRTKDPAIDTSKVLSNNQTRKASKMNTYNQNETQHTAVPTPHRDSKISDPDMIQNGMLNLTMNLEHSKNSIQHDSKKIGLIEALAKGGSEQKQDGTLAEVTLYNQTQKLANHSSQMIQPTRGSVQNLTALLKTHASQSTIGGTQRKHRRQQTKNSIHASIDSLKLNWMKEKEERKLFNEQFAQMNSSYGTQANQKIEEKANARRQRNQIQQQIKEIQSQMKEKRRQVEAQRVKNREMADQQEQSVDLYKRLCNILNMQSVGTSSGDGEKLVPGQASSSSIRLQQSSSQVLSASPGKAMESGQDIHGFYQFLFESDLKTAKDRTMSQLESVQSQADFNLKEIEVLTLEQHSLKTSIKRYQQMIQDITEQRTHPGRKAGERSILGEKGAQSSFVQQQLNKLEKAPEIETIDQLLYKYGDNKKAKNEETKSSFFGAMTANTPGLGGNFNKGGTHMSFAGRAPLFLEIKKAETITLRLAPVLKQTKALDSIVLQLAMMKEVFKAQKLTLFIVDPDLQASLFQNKNERKQNYKKIMLGGQNIIYGMYNNESDFNGPVFKDIEGAGQHMFNNKIIVIPLKEKKKTLMSLQVIYDSKMKVGRAAALNASVDASSRKGGAAAKRHARGKSQLSVASRSPSRRSRGGLGAEALSGATSQRSGRAHGGPVMPGWNQNDNNLLRILGGFLKLNVEYYNFQVQMKQKEQKIFEIIAFSQDVMQIKTYRQLVKKIKEYCTPLMGFDACAIFFQHSQSGELFTVADLGDNGKSDKAVDFAKELYFPDDQVVVFPATIGVTGEIHQKKGSRYENSFGQLIRPKDTEQDDQSDAQSFQTGMGYSRRSSLRNFFAQPTKTPRHGAGEAGGKLKTRLEQIKEDAPNEDAQALAGPFGSSIRQTRRSMHPSEGRFHNHSSLNLINQSELQSPLKPPLGGSIDGESNYSGVPGPLETLGKESGPSRNQYEPSPYPTQGEGTNKQDGTFGSYINNIDGGKLDATASISPGKDARDLKGLLAASATPAPEFSGNILDLTGETNGRRGRILGAQGNVARGAKGKKDATQNRWYADFTPDIDNFAGIKNLDNWLISSLRDDAYRFGDTSVGVIQFYNKTGGKAINKDDVARLDKISKFIGALSQKALHVCSSLSLVIGLNQNTSQTGVALKGIDTTPGMGPFQQLSIPSEVIRQQLETEKATEDLSPRTLALIKLHKFDKN